MKSERILPPIEAQPLSARREEETDLDLIGLLMQLWARKGLILLATLIGGLVGFAIGQLPPNQFRTSAVVQIEPRSGRISLPSELIGDLLSGRDPGREQIASLETESHIIRSRLILDEVVADQRLDLHVVPNQAPIIGELLMRRPLPLVGDLIPQEFVRVGERMRLAEFQPSPGRGSWVRVQVLPEGRVRVTLNDGEAVEGAVSERIDLPGGGYLEIADLRAAPGRVFLAVSRNNRAAANSVRGALGVRPRGNTGVVDFTMVGTARDDVIGILNSVIAIYQEQNLNRRSAEIDQSILFIEGQLPEVRTALAIANDRLQEFRRDRQVDELSRSTQDLLRRLLEIETRLEDIAFRREQALQRVTENHPEYRALVAEEELLRGRLQNLRTELANVPEAERELATLVAEAERARQLEVQLSGRIDQLRVLRASTVSNIRILEWAEVAPHIGPDRRRPAIMGSFGGLALAIMLVLGLNYLRRGVDDIRAIEALGLSLFATIEKVPGLSGVKPSDRRYGVALDQPTGAAAEAIRGLRTGMRFSLAASGTKSLMITSCAPADGKSFVSLNLALASGQAGARVLLIDGDMRRGFLRQYFDVPRNGPGLSDLLTGNSDLNTLLYHHAESGIDFLSSGRYPPNPAELLAGPVLAQFLDYACGVYDLVVIDAPPVLAVTDPAIIGQHVGMTLMVVRHLVTTPAEIQSAARSLSNSGIALSGVVLNQFDLRSSRYGNYGARYGYYAGGYSYEGR